MQPLQWNNVTPNFSGSGQSMAAAGENFKEVGNISQDFLRQMRQEKLDKEAAAERAYQHGREKVSDARATTLWDQQQAAKENALIVQQTATPEFQRQTLLDRDASNGVGQQALTNYLAAHKDANLSLEDVSKIVNGAAAPQPQMSNAPLLQNVGKDKGSIGGTASVYKNVTIPSNINPAAVVHAPGSKLLFRPDDVASKPFTSTAGPLERTLEMFSPAKTQKEQLKELNAHKFQENQYNGKLTQSEYNKLSPAEQTAYTRAGVSLLPKDAQVGVNAFLASMNPTTRRELVKAGTSRSNSASMSSSGYNMPADTGIVDRVYKDVGNAIPKDHKEDVQYMTNLLGSIAARGGMSGGGSTANDIGLSEIVKGAYGTGEASDADKSKFQIATAKAGSTLSQYNSDREFSLQKLKFAADQSFKSQELSLKRLAVKAEKDPISQQYLMNTALLEKDSMLMPAQQAYIAAHAIGAKEGYDSKEYTKAIDKANQITANLAPTQQHLATVAWNKSRK